MNDKLLEYKVITKTWHKNFMFDFQVIYICNMSEKDMIVRSTPKSDYICYKPQTILSANWINEKSRSRSWGDGGGGGVGDPYVLR